MSFIEYTFGFKAPYSSQQLNSAIGYVFVMRTLHFITFCLCILIARISRFIQTSPLPSTTVIWNLYTDHELFRDMDG